MGRKSYSRPSEKRRREMTSTTIEINSIDLSWWEDCKKKLKMNSKEVFALIKKRVEERKQQLLYDALPRPSNYVKPLSCVKINKNYRKNRYIL
jgi:hypothetical protein